MGNLHTTREVPAFINPAEFPYLHVNRKSDGTYNYVPSVGSPWNIEIHIGELAKGRLNSQVLLAKFKFPLVPPLSKVPPAPIETRSRFLLGFAGQDFPQILELLENEPQANILLSEHGSFWSDLPETRLRNLLIATDHDVNNGFPVVTNLSRKRIQTHAILINR